VRCRSKPGSACPSHLVGSLILSTLMHEQVKTAFKKHFDLSSGDNLLHNPFSKAGMVQKISRLEAGRNLVGAGQALLLPNSGFPTPWAGPLRGRWGSRSPTARARSSAGKPIVVLAATTTAFDSLRLISNHGYYDMLGLALALGTPSLAVSAYSKGSLHRSTPWGAISHT